PISPIPMLRITTLGTLRLERDGTPVPAPQPKRVALLAYLALAHPRGPHRRDTLLGMFWPELPEERARNALRQALHQLRAACGPGVLVTRGMHEVAVDPAAVRCDAHALEAAAARGDAAAVVAAYGGDLLPGLFAAGAGEWEDWLARERVRLRGLAADAGRTLARDAAAAGDAGAAARWVRWTCALDPLDEAAARWGMELLAGRGLGAAALELYGGLAAHLRREFDAAPGAETAALAAAVRAAMPPLATPAAPRITPRITPPVPTPAIATAEAPRMAVRRRWAVRARCMAAAGVLLAASLAAATDGDTSTYNENVVVLPARPPGAGAGDGRRAERIRAALAAAGVKTVSARGGPREVADALQAAGVSPETARMVGRLAARRARARASAADHSSTP
ncbi:MAG TPA: BTAD domain-containing putative transcriptional regulator, partial [Longimicrobium sp.]|nr:BTAD domain-containing putative transcriptional regulator [Longimicrobium sp.]